MTWRRIFTATSGSAVFETARKGAFSALDRLRDEGVIKAWGLGVNRVEPIELLLALEGPRPDGFLLAGRYSLLDHARALQRVMPMVAEHGLGIVVGGPYSSGALVGGPNFEYAPATPEILDKVARIKSIADRYGISMKAAGLQFALANPAVAAVIPGASRPGRIAEDRAALKSPSPPTSGASCAPPASSIPRHRYPRPTDRPSRSREGMSTNRSLWRRRT